MSRLVLLRERQLRKARIDRWSILEGLQFTCCTTRQLNSEVNFFLLHHFRKIRNTFETRRSLACNVGSLLRVAKFLINKPSITRTLQIYFFSQPANPANRLVFANWANCQLLISSLLSIFGRAFFFGGNKLVVVFLRKYLYRSSKLELQVKPSMPNFTSWVKRNE